MRAPGNLWTAPLCATEIDDPDGQGEEQKAQATNKQDVRTGPELLVDREGEVPQAAKQGATKSRDCDATGLLPERVAGAQPDAGEEAEERRRQCGQGAEQTLGIARPLVEMRGREDVPVEPRGQICVAIQNRDLARWRAVAGDRDEAHQEPVTDECGDGEPCLAAPPGAEDIERGDDEVADCYARKDSIEAHGVEVKKRKAVDDDAEEKEDDRAAKRVQKKRLAGSSAGEPGGGGEDGGDADEKEEGGEDEIGWREAVPLCVVEHPVGVAAIAVVVDEDHEADGKAAQEVEREQPVRLLLGELRLAPCGWFAHHAHCFISVASLGVWPQYRLERDATRAQLPVLPHRCRPEASR